MKYKISLYSKLRYYLWWRYKNIFIDWWYERSVVPRCIIWLYRILDKYLHNGYSYYVEGRPPFGIFFCRMRGHAGVVYYNPGGWEPDMHCKRCGEDLG